METQHTPASRLAFLTEQGADRFDPIRFSYLSSLVRRSEEQKAPVRQLLEQKALQAIDDYQARFETGREEAAQHVVRIAEKLPDAAELLRARFERGDFNGIRRMAERLDRDRGGSPIATLSDRIARAGQLAGENVAQFSIDALLQRQEEDAVGSLGGNGAPPLMPGTRLRAFHLLERTWATHYAETLVSHAITHVPENPGHLNSQMLATRCLAAMRQLAPAYLRRWVTYMETLLWLEGAGQDDGPRPTKASR